MSTLKEKIAKYLNEGPMPSLIKMAERPNAGNIAAKMAKSVAKRAAGVDDTIAGIRLEIAKLRVSANGATDARKTEIVRKIAQKLKRIQDLEKS